MNPVFTRDFKQFQLQTLTTPEGAVMVMLVKVPDKSRNAPRIDRAPFWTIKISGDSDIMNINTAARLISPLADYVSNGNEADVVRPPSEKLGDWCQLAKVSRGAVAFTDERPLFRPFMVK